MVKKLLLTLQKKSRIEQLLSRLHDERATRLEAASVNRKALRSQISRIRETVTRILNDDTTLAERLHTLFQEQVVTIASLLTALSFIISTVVLSIQNKFGGGGNYTTSSAHPDQSWRSRMGKKATKVLAGWLKALAWRWLWHCLELLVPSSLALEGRGCCGNLAS